MDKKSIKEYAAIVAVVMFAVAAVIIAMLFIQRDKKPDVTKGEYTQSVQYETESTAKQSGAKGESVLKTTAEPTTEVTTTEETTTKETTVPTTYLPESTYYNPPVTQQNTQVIAPGLNSTQPGTIHISEDLQYSLNLFLNNFVEADMESFSYRPSDEQLARFAVSFNFINKRENCERLDNLVEFNGRQYNYRLSKALAVESIENYFLIQVNDSFGEGIYNYNDGYFYWTFTGALVYDQVGVVTAVEYTGDNYYSIYFDLYENHTSNEGLYGYNKAQMQAFADSSEYTSYKGKGVALIKAENIYNYGTYYLYSYDVG